MSLQPTGPHKRGLGQSLLLRSWASPQACGSKAAFVKCSSTQLGFSRKQNILLKDLKTNYY